MSTSPAFGPGPRATTDDERPWILGGYQTDFARNVTKEGGSLTSLIAEAANGALAAAGLTPADIDTAHVGNFLGEVYCEQGHLGGLLAEAVPGLGGPDGLLTARHEAACASGSVALLAATGDLAADRGEVTLVVGVELMRAEGGFAAQRHLGAAALRDEVVGVDYPWPDLFAQLADEYDRRYGLDAIHLQALSAARNPLAQSRTWGVGAAHLAADDDLNPVVAGRLRRYDCSQVSDGAVAVVLATPARGREWARHRRIAHGRVARIAGWGARTARMSMQGKLTDSREDPHVLPHVATAARDALSRAGLTGVGQLDAVEVHDCFTISAYAAIDHLGITPPGKSYQAIEDGVVAADGTLPLNPSGGLIGLGHPVGATGVRMLWNAAQQVTESAGDTQISGAARVGTLNIGGSATTVVSFVVEQVNSSGGV